MQTALTAKDLPDDLSRLRSRIEAAIPVGRSARANAADPARLHGFPVSGWAEFWERFDTLAPPVKARRERAMAQMGTLGSGNHFIEFCLDADDRVWLMLHSGSRNIGKELAEHHIGVARSLAHNQGLVDRDLAVFLQYTPQMEAYRTDLFWAQHLGEGNSKDFATLRRLALAA
jgi:tRNA-splicing ligase RtcB